MNPAIGDKADQVDHWEINNQYLTKKVFPAAKPDEINPTEISDNIQLYQHQLVGLENTINNFLKKTIFPGGFASPISSVNLADYTIYLGADENAEEDLEYKVNTFFPLIRFAKTQFGYKRLSTIPLFETATCFNIQWTRFNKIGVPDTLLSVGQLVNNPKVVGEDGVHFTSTIPRTEDCDCVEVDPADKNAVLKQTSFSPLKNNIVTLLFTVYVDPFAENTLVDEKGELLNVPHLLELNFLTTFFFDYEKGDKKLNPAFVCPQPRHSGNTFFERAFGI
jgi:hypothetical protein